MLQEVELGVEQVDLFSEHRSFGRDGSWKQKYPKPRVDRRFEDAPGGMFFSCLLICSFRAVSAHVSKMPENLPEKRSEVPKKYQKFGLKIRFIESQVNNWLENTATSLLQSGGKQELAQKDFRSIVRVQLAR
jgi:hypothetical protein